MTPPPLLDDVDVDARLGAGPWRREGSQIVCELELGDFAQAIALVNRVAEAAEAANHHPDILVHDYRRVRLVLATHSAGGLTEADLAMAARIDELV